MNVVSTVQSQENYIQVITQRANKITVQLNITDSSKFFQVQNILVKQYQQLNDVFNQFNEKVNTYKKDSSLNKEAKAMAINTVEAERLQTLSKIHKSFIESLGQQITEKQIEQIKDAMTYNKLNVTYNAYIAMIPSLTDKQKEAIYKWLVEAREYAMDAGSSEKKTEWFGKYKGRINNYLSAEGYDMKKEEQAWQQRIKEAKMNKNS